MGIDVRLRSTTLSVNYRTSRQIRRSADRLLPGAVLDADGIEEIRRETISVFEGVEPDVRVCSSYDEEVEQGAQFIRVAVMEGIAPDEIGVFVRSRAELARAKAAVRAAGLDATEDRATSGNAWVRVGTMHLAKGLEFRAVLVLACDAGVIPSPERISDVSDESELDEVYETERQLLYVACTRARDRLLVSGVRPASEYLDDLTPQP